MDRSSSLRIAPRSNVFPAGEVSTAHPGLQNKTERLKASEPNLRLIALIFDVLILANDFS
jgi:hypothetical protein